MDKYIAYGALGTAVLVVSGLIGYKIISINKNKSCILVTNEDGVGDIVGEEVAIADKNQPLIDDSEEENLETQ